MSCRTLRRSPLSYALGVSGEPLLAAITLVPVLIGIVRTDGVPPWPAFAVCFACFVGLVLSLTAGVRLREGELLIGSPVWPYRIEIDQVARVAEGKAAWGRTPIDGIEVTLNSGAQVKVPTSTFLGHTRRYEWVAEIAAHCGLELSHPGTSRFR